MDYINDLAPLLGALYILVIVAGILWIVAGILWVVSKKE